MQVTVLLLADYVSQTESGTFTFVGAGLNSLTVRQFPAVWPLLFLFIRLRSTRIDAGTHTMEVRIAGETGVIVKVEGVIEVDRGFPEREDCANLPLRLANIPFERAGEYRVEVLVNGRELASQTLRVRQLQPLEGGRVS